MGKCKKVSGANRVDGNRMRQCKGGKGIGSRGRDWDGARGEGKGKAWCGIML